MPVVVGKIRREHVEAFMEDLLARRAPATAHNRFRGPSRLPPVYPRSCARATGMAEAQVVTASRAVVAKQSDASATLEARDDSGNLIGEFIVDKVYEGWTLSSYSFKAGEAACTR